MLMLNGNVEIDIERKLLFVEITRDFRMLNMENSGCTLITLKKEMLTFSLKSK